MNSLFQPISGLLALRPHSLLLLLGTLALGGCVDSDLQLAEGIGGTGIIRGTAYITNNQTANQTSDGMGSPPPTNINYLIVGGTLFNIAQATFNNCHGKIDNTTQSVLPAQQELVEVEGTIDANGVTGIATTVTCYSARLTGPVTRVYDGSTLQVMYQTVIPDSDTDIQTTLLQPGRLVNVHGHADTRGNIHTNSVTEATQDSPLRVNGLISRLDTDQLTFHINALRVDYAYASIIGLPDTGIKEGMRVAVTAIQALENTKLVASEVLVYTITHPPAGTPYRAVGRVSHMTSPTEFEVLGQRILVTPATVFTSGDSSALSQSPRVEVIGIINAEGLLIAEEIDMPSLSTNNPALPQLITPPSPATPSVTSPDDQEVLIPGQVILPTPPTNTSPNTLSPATFPGNTSTPVLSTPDNSFTLQSAGREDN